MPSGHTNRATINARRPMTATMAAALRDYLTEAQPADRTQAEKNADRALLNRGYLAEVAPMKGLYVTPTGEAALHVYDTGAVMTKPAVRSKVVTAPPPVRATVCSKCPFGDTLNAFERIGAGAIKADLRGRPNALWGCHETAGENDRVGAKTLLCAGFVAWKNKGMPL